MNIMKMPGFSAEASLYRTSRQYRMASNYVLGSHQVLPQLKSIGFCMADCDFTESDPLLRDVCKLRCFEQGDGGGDGGPGGEVCRPSCTPCRRVPGRVGLWKTCVGRDCETRDVRCGVAAP
jgi:hypothetical protein